MKKALELLTKTRKQRRVSVTDLANSTDYTRASIYRYERGEYNSIAKDKLARIAVYLDVHLDELLSALHQDGLNESDLNIVTDLYRAYYEDKHGPIPTLEVESVGRDKRGGLHIEVDAVLTEHAKETLDYLYELFENDEATYDHINLVKYCVTELNDKEADKALRLLKMVFEE